MKAEINLSTILIGVVGYYLVIKPKYQKRIILPTESNISKKFPGYEIKNQMIYITDIKKAKEYVFSIGFKEPEGNLFKLAFGSDNISYSDAKKDWIGNTNIVVKDKVQQDSVYILLSYLFTGAYQQSPHRVGHYADIINKYVVYLKTMFNVDYIVLKTVDQAKEFFEGLAKTL